LASKWYNSASYRNITSIGSAGVFEFHQIAAISGNNITFTRSRVRTFGNPATDTIQLVKVAYSSSNLTITGTVTALPWDGSKDGIVIIETDGTLSFNAKYQCAGAGLPRGLYSVNGGSSSACNYNTYFGSVDDQAGRKGERVANWPGFNYYAYRGKLASGGGGGNNHNTGGGGGSNYGAGGQGEWATCGSRWWCPGLDVANSGWGYGGVALSSYLNPSAMRAFMGGGGAAATKITVKVARAAMAAVSSSSEPLPSQEMGFRSSLRTTLAVGTPLSVGDAPTPVTTAQGVEEAAALSSFSVIPTWGLST
jgi:hypothetical protein